MFNFIITACCCAVKMTMFRCFNILLLLALAGTTFQVQASVSPVEFCIDKAGNLTILFADNENGLRSFSGSAAFQSSFYNSPLVLSETSSSDGLQASIKQFKSLCNYSVSVLTGQFIYHFGIKHFLVTDLPPPSGMA